ncbi:MAG TPA: type 1 glutamine amidotransferase [Myxococcaceae bacterium]|nr:type 1 glutamine amidotransferase [Myxococcaceae bacterium]
MRRSRVLVVQHVPNEGLGQFESILDRFGVGTETIRPSASIRSDALGGASGLIVLGGPMGVYESDRYPRLVDEQQLIRTALASRVPVLGICLGSQLLASALGARVYPAPAKEIGWYDVTLEPKAGSDPLFSGAPERFKALHWHGDVFDLPDGAVPLARSAMTPHQAFGYRGVAWGLLFHLEAGVEEVRKMAAAFPEEVATVDGGAERLVADAERFYGETAEMGQQVLSRWLGLLVRGGSG